MLPLLRQQLDFGEFIYDAALPAMRATLYGLESGAVDLLITDKKTYQLNGGAADSPASCTALGRLYSPPTTRWLAKTPLCDGEAPVGSKMVQWWKTPDVNGRAAWQWYTTDQRLPWRTMFSSRMAEPAVIGDYGITYFPTFEPLAQTPLARLRDLCAAHAQKPDAHQAAAKTARDLMAASADRADRAARIEKLVPGLSLNACSSLNGGAPRNRANCAIVALIFSKALDCGSINSKWIGASP